MSIEDLNTTIMIEIIKWLLGIVIEDFEGL